MNISNVSTTTQPTEVVPPTIIQDGSNVSTETFKPVDVKAKEEQGESKLSLEELEVVTEELNEYMDDLQTNLGFSIHKKLNHQVVVEIKNRDTDELIKQIPSEELLGIKEKMEELTGILFDDQF